MRTFCAECEQHPVVQAIANGVRPPANEDGYPVLLRLFANSK